MSIYRQNSVDDVQSIYGSKLMVKDSQIQKLQNEVAELTQAKLDYQHSEEALDKLKKRVADIEKQKDKLDWNNNQAARLLDANLKSLKSDFENLSITFKSKGAELGDLTIEKKGLENTIQQKNIQIQKLKEKSQIEDRSNFLNSQYQSLSQQQQFVKSQIKQLNQDLDQTSKTHKDISRSLSNKQSTVIALRLQIQNKDRKLDHYQKQNNALDAEIEDLIQKQTRLLRQICDQQDTQKQLGLQQINLKSKIKKLENELDDLNRQIKLYEKEKNKQAKNNIKNRENTLKKLNEAQQTEHREINILTKKNGEIAEINNKLKEDSQFCQQHLSNVKRCNELMIQFLEKCRNEDKTIIQLIQKRLTTSSNVTDKNVVPIANNSKMAYSRSTQNSAWLDI